MVMLKERFVGAFDLANDKFKETHQNTLDHYTYLTLDHYTYLTLVTILT